MAEQLLAQQTQLQQLGAGASAAIRDWLLRLEALRYAPARVPAHSADASSLLALRREFGQLPWPK